MRRLFTIACLGALTTSLCADLQPEAAVEVPAADEPQPGMFGRLLEGWSGGFELGISGSEGNVDRFTGRAGVRGERRSEWNESRAELTYIYAKTDGETTQNQANFLVRNDRLFKDSPWRLFGIGMVDYDEFKDWDVRLSGFLGVGYAFIDEERTRLIGRLGAGLLREFGGEENAIIPEGLIGADFEHKLTERQKITASFDFFPELREFGPYRFIAKAAWEVLVDPEVNLSLRVGIEDRYDSTPGAGQKRNDLDYFATVVWSF